MADIGQMFEIFFLIPQPPTSKSSRTCITILPPRELLKSSDWNCNKLMISKEQIMKMIHCSKEKKSQTFVDAESFARPSPLNLPKHVTVGHEAVRWNPPRLSDRVLRKYIPDFNLFLSVLFRWHRDVRMSNCGTVEIGGQKLGCECFRLFCFYIVVERYMNSKECS